MRRTLVPPVRVSKRAVLRGLLLLLAWCPMVRAQIGASPEQAVARYGKPEREAFNGKGLLYFRKDGLCLIAHFQKGRCDVLSIFSGKSEMGVAEDLWDRRIDQLLATEGGGPDWRLTRYAINGLWLSRDGQRLAIYDTMRHKLVIMTRDAYNRDQEILREARSGVP
jgi:hypothetical protein